MRGSKRFFFAQDYYCYWFMIPEVLRKRWYELTSSESEDNEDAISDEFADFRIGSDISHISFTSPKK